MLAAKLTSVSGPATASVPGPTDATHGGATPKPEPSILEGMLGSAAFRSFARSAASALGREITRSIFGTARRR